MSRRKGKPAAAANHERWLITYADLVTLLFALFIILFASADPNGEKFARNAAQLREAFDVGIFGGGGEPTVLDGGGGLAPGGGTAQTSEAEILSDAITGAALELGLRQQVTVTIGEGSVVVSLSNNLLFTPASADLSPAAAPLLNRLGEMIATLPNELEIEGHTDDIPPNTVTFPTNWELSAGRATAVLRYFVDHLGMDPARLRATGYAEFRPVADNATPEGRARNRRADLVILFPQNGESLLSSGITAFPPDLAAEAAQQAAAPTPNGSAPAPNSEAAGTGPDASTAPVAQEE